MPEPQKLGTHTAELLPLASNRRYGVDALIELRYRSPAEDELWQVDQLLSDEPQERPVATDALLTPGDIENAQFKTVRLTAGYDEDEVDEFLDKVAIALGDSPLGPQWMRPEDVRNTHFTTTRMREGYDVEEVDSFLDRIELEFARRQALAAERGTAP